MQAEAFAEGEVGEHARRSVIRKFYLYLVLFAAVIGGMATAVALVYQLIRVVLNGDTGAGFANDLLNLVQLSYRIINAAGNLREPLALALGF